MTRPTGEPRLASAASWLVLAASFGLSAATWIALARLAGFDGDVRIYGLTVLALAWLMPLAVDGYIVVALVLWLSPVPARIARFAKVNTYCAASVGVAAQSAYHCLLILDRTETPWRAVLAAVVGAIPPAVAALSVHMRALIRRESRTASPDVRVDTNPDMNPAAEPRFTQVSAPPRVDIPADMPADPEAATNGSKPARGSAPKRPFALTQQAAASMDAGGMTVAEIAAALGITERQARRALRPVPVDQNAAGGTDPQA